MIPVDDITKCLPPLHDDEPPSLRQNIVDEILDHLRCSLRRELLARGDDQAAATQRVLKRFGDPSQVARKLWFQAMWSKIMTQRLLVGSTVCSMAVSISMVVMLGWLMNQMHSQQLDQQKFNASLIEQMSKLNQPALVAPRERDPNWNSLLIKLTSGAKDGPAARDIEVQVGRLPGIGEEGAGQGSQSITIDESGIGDCGFVKAGTYEAIVTTSWNERAVARFMVHPGQDHIEQIIIPEMPELTKVSFNMQGIADELPEKSNDDDAGSSASRPVLPSKSHVLVIEFQPIDGHEFAGRKWTKGQRAIVGETQPFLMVVPHRGAWMTEIRNQFPASIDAMTNSEGIWPPRLAKAANWVPLDPTQGFEFPVNRYSVSYALVELRKMTYPDKESWKNSIVSDTCSPIHSDDGVPPQQIFVAASGMVNQWEITLPKEVVRRFQGEDP